MITYHVTLTEPDGRSVAQLDMPVNPRHIYLRRIDDDEDGAERFEVIGSDNEIDSPLSHHFSRVVCVHVTPLERVALFVRDDDE